MKGCEVLRAAKQLSYIYEGEPAQVEQYCPLIWNPKIFDIVLIARFAKPFTLSKQPVTFPLAAEAADNKAFRARLSEIARARGKTAVLQLKGVEAETEPGAVWEVYVGPAGLKPNPGSPSFRRSARTFCRWRQDKARTLPPGRIRLPDRQGDQRRWRCCETAGYFRAGFGCRSEGPRAIRGDARRCGSR